jgi:two-component system, chemotaxis family, CheB/CheR fusion protein
MEVEEQDPQFEALLEFLRDERGFDFTGYKRSSLMRRVRKRMQEVGIEPFGEYQTFLETHPDEFANLFDTILINLTEFFRDLPTWDFLRSEVVPRIIAGKDSGEHLRVWCAGVASGQEAYTATMVLAEELGERGFRERVKVYATDVDEHALNQGRHSTYSHKEVESVPPELKEKYFLRTETGYAFLPDLRRCVIFGRHDLVKDPPISRIDLLISRNTMMYLTSETQRRVLSHFHFALNPDGFLFLGKSEALVTRTDLFTPFDLKRRIFTKSLSEARNAAVAPVVIDQAKASPEPAVEDLLGPGLDAVPVAHLVIDGEDRLAIANGSARSLFKLSQKDIGRQFRDLEVSFRPLELRSRIEEATNGGHPIRVNDVEWAGPIGPRYFDILVAPLHLRGHARGIAITFQDVTRFNLLQKDVEQSKNELETAYEELQSTVEELETTNEELQSTNEELETTNEELQSTNEELETMNAELQSTNEELEAFNNEIALKTSELDETNAFLEGILGNMESGVVVVDQDLRVKSWNQRAEDLWGVRADEARSEHFLNLDIGLPVDRLRGPLRSVLAGDAADGPVVLEALTRKGRTIECTVRLNALHDSERKTVGVILLMDEQKAEQ